MTKSLVRFGVIGPRGLHAAQGGIETYCRSVYPAMRLETDRITIFVRSRDPRPRGLPRQVEIRTVPTVAFRAAATPLYSLAATVRARLLGCDTVHVHALSAALAIPLAKSLGMRVVLRHVGPEYDRDRWGPLARATLRWAERLAARYADTITFLTDHDRCRFLARHRFGGKHVVIRNGVPSPRFRPPCELHAEFGLVPGRYVISVGRLVPEKGIDRLIEAFGQSGLAGLDWKLVVVGEFDHDARFRRTIRHVAASTPGTVLVGPRFNAPLESLLTGAGLFVQPSSHEGMSFSLLEAMAYGLRCLATDIPVNRELGLQEDWYVPLDTRSLAERMARVTGLPWPDADRHRLMRRIHEEFSVQETADKTLEVLRGKFPPRVPEARAGEISVPLAGVRS